MPKQTLIVMLLMAVALVGCKKTKKNPPAKENAPIKVENRAPFQLTPSKVTLPAARSHASVIPAASTFTVQLKSMAWLFATLPKEAFDEENAKPSTIKWFDAADLQRSGVALDKPMTLFVADDNFRVIGSVSSLSDPAKLLARYKAATPPRTVSTRNGWTVVEDGRARVLVRGQTMVTLKLEKNSEPIATLEAAVTRITTLTPAQSLASLAAYEKTMTKLNFGKHVVAFVNLQAMLARLGKTMGEQERKILMQLGTLAVGATLESNRLLAKLTMVVSKKGGIFAAFRQTQPAVGWTAIDSAPLLAFNLGIDFQTYLKAIIEIAGPASPMITAALDKPVLSGHTPRQLIEMMGDRMEFYGTGPSTLTDPKQLDGSLFFRLRKPKALDALLQKVVKEKGGVFVTEQTIGTTKLNKITVPGLGKPIYFGILRSHLLITTDADVVKRFAAGKRQSWADKIADAQIKSMATSNSLGYMELGLGDVLKVVRLTEKMKGKLKTKDAAYYEIFSTAGVIAVNSIDAPHGVDGNLIWRLSGGNFYDMVKGLVRVAKQFDEPSKPPVK